LKVQYRQTFLKDLKQLKSSESYQRIYELAFTTLENINSLDEILDIKAMKGYPNRYRIRIGNYRLGIEVNGDLI
jgi:mRNA interferase RelE/StbE